MKQTGVYLSFLALAALMFLVGYNFGLVRSCSGSWDSGGITFEVRRDTVRVRDTVIEPLPVSVNVIRHDTIMLPNDTVYLPIESKKYVQELSTDSISGSISVSLSGYDARLDSLIWDIRVAKERVYVEKRKRWGWSVTAGPGIGYDFTGRRMVPTVGVIVGFGYGF